MKTNALSVPSGTNVHVVAEQPPPPAQTAQSNRRVQVFTMSAKSEAALVALAQLHVAHLANDLDEDVQALDDICFTVNCGRAQNACRFAVAVKSVRQLHTELTAYVNKSASSRAKTGVVVSKAVARYDAVKVVGNRVKADDASGWKPPAIKNDSDVAAALADLYVAGHSIDWASWDDSPRCKVVLPTYPYQRQPWWVPGLQGTHASPL